MLRELGDFAGQGIDLPGLLFEKTADRMKIIFSRGRLAGGNLRMGRGAGGFLRAKMRSGGEKAGDGKSESETAHGMHHLLMSPAPRKLPRASLQFQRRRLKCISCLNGLNDPWLPHLGDPSKAMAAARKRRTSRSRTPRTFSSACGALTPINRGATGSARENSMEHADWRASAAPAAPAADDFAALLRSKGLYPQLPSALTAPAPASPAQTEGTTILAFKFADGVLVAGDRRATAGNVVVYDRADKVLEIDSFSLMAIAGVPATAWEMARVLEHSFQFYRRSQLQEMSLEGKVRALSKLLRDNLGFVMQGIGVVVPIFATYDLEADLPRLYFYDAMGAQFEAADYAASGSGGHAVRSILYYENTFGQKPLRKRTEQQAILVALRALDTAAESDTATGGVDRRGRVYPIVKLISRKGITTLPEKQLARLFREKVA